MSRLSPSLRKLRRLAVDTLIDRTVFGTNRGVRLESLRALGKRQRFVISAPPDRAAFVFDPGDAIIGREIFLTGGFDFDKFELALRLLEQHRGIKPNVLIDVGANIGTICVEAVAGDFVSTAVAVEADPANARMLRANIVLTGLTGGFGSTKSRPGRATINRCCSSLRATTSAITGSGRRWTTATSASSRVRRWKCARPGSIRYAQQSERPAL